MALESINPRTVSEDKETIGTIQVSATVERQDGKVTRMHNGALLDNNTHVGNFSQEPNGQFYMNLIKNDAETLKSVFGALPIFLNNVNAAV